VTCSVLPEENGDQVSRFIAANPEFRPLPYPGVWRQAIASHPPPSADGSSETLLMTPLDHETDGFFIAVMERTA
jgi:16S rRNA (cytosine967-C5)-methyltransferase